MQRPILKDGVVVNVIEIDEDAMIMTKAQHKELHAEEDAAYDVQAKAWRESMKDRHGELSIAMDRLGLANMTLSAVKAKAAGEKQDAKAALFLNQILSMEAEIEELKKGVAAIQARPAPAKPKLVRAKRWYHPDDCEVGPVGGSIGDRWDGKQYVRPAKAIADSITPEKVDA